MTTANNNGQPVAVVTGAAQGIGRAIAVELARSDIRVVIADRSAGAAQSAADELIAEGLDAHAQTMDVTDTDQVQSTFDEIEGRLGAIEIVVNNAGINTNAGIRKMTDQNWRATLDVNLTGVKNCSQAAARSMVPRGGGRIINIASRAWLGWFGQSAYAASKGGVVSLTRSLAVELARHRITVNAVAPGLIDTPMLREEPPEILEKLMQAQPSGTIGDASSVGWAVKYLASPGARAVTGQVLYVCGGKSLYAQPA